MILRHRSLALFSVCLGAISLGACGKLRPPKPAPAQPPLTIAAAPNAVVKALMTISTSADVNPDASGRPSPIVIRIYQLKTDAAFTAAEFLTLFDDDKKVLGPELISRDEFVLGPAERRTLDVTVAAETRYVGAVAAFRDIRNAQWRVLVPAPRKGLTMAVERARVMLTPAGN
jgi:type VI secretion system protein VasD